MKTNILLFLIVFRVFTLQAQDTLQMRDGERSIVKIDEITDDWVKYRRFDQADGPVYTVEKSRIGSIRLSNGEVEVFGAEASETAPDSRKYTVGAIYRENGVEGMVVREKRPDCPGLIVAFNTPSARMKASRVIWCTKDAVCVTGADDPDNGLKNMQRIEALIRQKNLTWDHFPAFKMCRELGPGWYLPAIREVEAIILAVNGGDLKRIDKFSMKMFNMQLKAYGGDPIQLKSGMFSSTETSKVSAESYISMYETNGFFSSGEHRMTTWPFVKTKNNLLLDIRPVHQF